MIKFWYRKESSTSLLERFNSILLEYMESGKLREQGLPQIDQIAQDMSVSQRYLSDALNVETGKTATEHIHLFLVDEAKDVLLHPGASVSEVAYELGFEYPQYFSRLFKKKVGVSPTSYQREDSLI